MEDSTKPASESEPPPVLGSWRRIYWFVAAFFVFEVVVFHLFTKFYS